METLPGCRLSPMETSGEARRPRVNHAFNPLFLPPPIEKKGLKEYKGEEKNHNGKYGVFKFYALVVTPGISNFMLSCQRI